MRRIPLVLVLFVVAVLSAAFAWGGSSTPTAFRLPDASAACRLQGERLVCANLRVASGLVLAPRGTPRAVDARVWWDASTLVASSQWAGRMSGRSTFGATHPPRYFDVCQS